MEFQPIVSSNLESAGFDAKGRKAVIRFKNGTAYEYTKFMPSLWLVTNTTESDDMPGNTA